MKVYRKTATIQAKMFEQGDEDGFIHTIKDLDSVTIRVTSPYIETLENQHHLGEFGKHYLCVGIDGERWLVEKSIFERTYEECKS